MERNYQDHHQELQRLKQSAELDKQRLAHTAKLKKEALEVGVSHCI